MAPDLDCFRNPILFARLWPEADKTPTVFVGLDVEHLEQKSAIGEIGLAAFRKGDTEALAVHHLIIRANLKTRPRALASCFPPSVEVATYHELITNLNQILSQFAIEFERVVIVGCGLVSDFCALRVACGWVPADCFKPNVINNIYAIDIQWLAEDGLVLHTAQGIQLRHLVRALGLYVDAPHNHKPYHNGAHDAWWAVKCLFVQGDLYTGQLPRAQPTFAPPPAPTGGNKKRKRQEREEDEEDGRPQDNTDAQENGGEQTQVPPIDNMLPTRAGAAPLLGKSPRTTAASLSATQLPHNRPLDFPQPHQSEATMASTSLPTDTLALFDMLTARHAEESRLQREFMMAMNERMDARDEKMQDAIAATNARMADIAEKALDMLSNAFNQLANQPQAQYFNAPEHNGSERDKGKTQEAVRGDGRGGGHRVEDMLEATACQGERLN